MGKNDSLIRKKLLFKLALILVSFTLLTFLTFYLFGDQLISVYFFLGFGLLFTFIAFIVYYYEFARPLKLILFQIKALLTGKRYKKIYSNRTDEIGIIAHFFNEVTTTFEKVSDKIIEGKNVTGELEKAGQLQKELMPLQAPAVEGFEIAVKNRSAEELGGDNLDFIKIKNSYYFYCGDVTGHGVPAAIVMTMVNTLINAYTEIFDNAYDVIVQTNRRLKSRIRATMFMSMLMMKWDGDKDKLTYVGCGHEHLVIYRAKERKCEVSKSGGIALGMVPDNSKLVKEKEIFLNEGDMVVMYTDGITEAKNMKGEMFGLDRLVDTVNLYAGDASADELVNEIARVFSKFVEEHVQEDDVTLIIAKFIGKGKGGKAHIDHKQGKWNEAENVGDVEGDDEKGGLLLGG